MLKNPNIYDKGKTIIYFVRHGERIHIPNSPNAGMIIPGPELTEKGKMQAKKIGKKFSKIKEEIDVLYSSDMTRAIETAEEIGKKIDKKPIIVRGISEFNKIVWEKKFHKLNFWRHYSKQKRTIKVFDRILKKNKGKVVVLVVHGNVIKALIFRKMGISLKKSGMFHHMNCNVSIARYKGKKLEHVCCFNSNDLKYS